MKEPFFAGQEIICIETCFNIYGEGVVRDQTYTAHNVKQCRCGEWFVDVGLRDAKRKVGCCICREILTTTGECWIGAGAFAAIPKTKIKYVKKEVEVSSSIQKLQKTAN